MWQDKSAQFRRITIVSIILQWLSCPSKFDSAGTAVIFYWLSNHLPERTLSRISRKKFRNILLKMINLHMGYVYVTGYYTLIWSDIAPSHRHKACSSLPTIGAMPLHFRSFAPVHPRDTTPSWTASSFVHYIPLLLKDYLHASTSS